MPPTAISVDHVCKRYDIGVSGENMFQYGSLRESMAVAASSALQRLRGGRSGLEVSVDHIWALDDVSFSVNRGEVIGIIGRNGAGKSTLLKILSRITKPTSGYAQIYGRLGSLLEVGTGFHPELTGRDNIFLNGAMLGMRRQEINQRFDSIADFSGIAKFLDTPVKRYSSGMYVRLAFAVAAHLEPEILLVDEVLAVGDAEFQKKCLGKMKSVVGEGRTVLFVSHNMAAVKSLCDRALLLDAGSVVAEGHVDEVVERYLGLAREIEPGGSIPEDAVRSGTGEARFRHVELLTQDDRQSGEFYFGQRIRVRMTVEVMESVEPVVAGVVIESLEGMKVACSFSTDCEMDPYTLSLGWHVLTVDINVTLLPRTYTIGVYLNRTDGYDVDVVTRTAQMSVLNVATTGRDSYPWETLQGYVRAPSQWCAPEPVDPSTVGSHDPVASPTQPD
ncbi:MAG: ABC transporter ATP-binding protein [Acidimicrobiales bacterium]|nr:ABC transporter ATP-binding protein [Acidimicrobiales bacterium]